MISQVTEVFSGRKKAPLSHELSIKTSEISMCQEL